MASRSLVTPATQRMLVTLAAFGAALVVGSLLVRDFKMGVALIGAMVFAPIAFVAPPLALSGWLVTVFMTNIPAVGAASNRALLVVFVAWVGTLAATRSGRYATRRRIPQIGLVIAWVAWLAITLAWAPTFSVSGDASEAVLEQVMGVLVFVMVVSLLTEPRHIRWFATAFVLGCTLSVLYGLFAGGVDPEEGRLQGGTADPNYLAAAIVPAIALAAALAVRKGRPFVRLGLLVSVLILAIGLVATESRGGLLAIGVVGIGALVLWRGRRMRIAGVIALFVVLVGFWFTISPTAWDRITSRDASGSGRTEIWTIAWRVVDDHPVFGVGLDQFTVVSPGYVREPGALSWVNLIVDQKIVVHNLYLQLWVETGLIGLLLFLAIVLRAVTAGYRAANAFLARGDPEMATLARAIILALIGALAASFFLSNVNDLRLWALLGLCPALLLIARR